MLSVVFKILSVIGILLLALLLLALAVLLLVLFCPISYRVSGAKDGEGFRISARIRWLLGLVRIQYGYPEPGELAAKVLFFTLFQTRIPPEESAAGDGEAEKKAAGKTASFFGKQSAKVKEQAAKKEDSPKEETEKAVSGNDERENADEGSGNIEGINIENANAVQGTHADEKPSAIAESSNEKDSEEAPHSFFGKLGKILQKFVKIKYTIHSIYDKIKEIWDTISYYLTLLQEEETRQLLSHVRLHSGRILKSIRPRHIRAQILFGTGAPDTTGYLYGAYCMLAPMLGGDVSVTPDFEEAVLEADFSLSGHITLWILAVNAGRIALDKRLHRLIRKVKASKGSTNHKEEQQEAA